MRVIEAGLTLGPWSTTVRLRRVDPLSRAMVGVSECRVSVVGEEGVGKAALVNSFLGGDFNKVGTY